MRQFTAAPSLSDSDCALDTIPTPAVKPARKARAKKVAPESGPATKTPSAAVLARQHAAKQAERWAHAYTYSAVVLSAGLNAYAAAVESGQSSLVGQGASAVIGAIIPVLVWMLGSVTAWTWRAGWKRLAYCTGVVAGCVLALSVVHVAGALSALTGAGPILAGLLAVGIDCGLVSSEATAILVSSPE
jgi:hypothetical protein